MAGQAQTFKNLFGIYYGLYRGEATPPGTTDDEWAIAIRNYNDALNRLMVADDTKWEFLWTTAAKLGTGATKTVTSYLTTTYPGPTNMIEPGGEFALIDSNNNRTNYPILFKHEVQNMDAPATTIYGYWSGGRQSGWTLNVVGMTSTNNGNTIDYDYYRLPTYLIASTDDGTVETGTTVVEDCDPAFLYNHMLAQRLKVDENWNSYQVALRDSEEAFKNMKLKNNSGTHFQDWTIKDTSGVGFGY